MTEISDAELLERFRRGDRAAFATLVRRWEGFLLRIAARVTGDRDEAEEVRQAVFLRLLSSPKAARRADRFGAWLGRVVINEAIGAVRKRNRRRAATARLHTRSTVPATSGPGDILAATDEAARLSAALALLEPEERALLALRFDEDLAFAEIADSRIRDRTGHRTPILFPRIFPDNQSE